MTGPKVEGWVLVRIVDRSVWCVWERWVYMRGREHSEVIVHLVVGFDSAPKSWGCQVGGLADRLSILDRFHNVWRCLYQEWLLWGVQ